MKEFKISINTVDADSLVEKLERLAKLVRTYQDEIDGLEIDDMFSTSFATITYVAFDID